jgi:hypothetical protein
MIAGIFMWAAHRTMREIDRSVTFRSNAELEARRSTKEDSFFGTLTPVVLLSAPPSSAAKSPTTASSSAFVMRSSSVSSSNGCSVEAAAAGTKISPTIEVDHLFKSEQVSLLEYVDG